MKLRANGGGKMVCVVKVNGMGFPNIFHANRAGG